MNPCFFTRRVSIISLAGLLSAHAAGPYSLTQPPWAVTSTLNGMAGPAGLPSTAWFEWGETTAYGRTTPPVAVGASTGVVRVSEVLNNLVQGQIYHCRLVVSNVTGVAFGMDQPLITAGSAKPAFLGSMGHCEFPVEPPQCLHHGGGGPGTIPLGVSNIVAVSARGWMLRGDGTVVGTHSGESTDATIVAISGGWALRADGTVAAHYDGLDPENLDDVIAVATGFIPRLALRSDGTVVAWEHELGLATNVAAGLSNVVAISAGAYHSLALHIDGTVTAWGRNGGQTNVPDGLTNVVAVAAGESMSLALRRDGTVVAWPDPWTTNLPPGLGNVIAIAAAGTAYALCSDGTVLQWVPGGMGRGGEPIPPFHIRYMTSIVAIAAAPQSPPHLALGGNQAPVNYEAPLLSYGFQDRDLIVQLDASDANGDSLRFRIASLPRMGRLYQFANGARGPAILTPETLVTDPGQRVIFAPDADSNDLNPRFTFIANDGELDSTPIVVALLIPPVFPRISIHRWDHYSTIQFVGETNNAYRLWGSTNLLDWDVLGTASPWDTDNFVFDPLMFFSPPSDGTFSPWFFKVSSP